jgi:transposase
MAEQRRFGNDGLQIARDLFAAWDSYQADRDSARLQAQIAPLQGKLRALLEHAARQSPRTKYHRVFAKNLLKRWPALWTFTHTDGVEPTNNHVERGLRGAVIYRKLSRGSNQTKANAPSSGSSPPRSPAASSAARSSPTSPTSSPPRSAATPYPRSPERGHLNAYM